MTTPNDVSVVICTRDRPEFLRSALAALLPRLPDGVEVLVVDSASVTTDTLEIATAAGVRAVRSEVPGLSIARNLGIAHTARPIVAFTDDDCEPQQGWIEALLAAFSSDPRVGAVTGVLVSGDDPLPSGITERRLSDPRDGLDAGHGALMAYTRAALVDAGGFDDVLGAGRWAAGAEDLDMFCAVLDTGRLLVATPDAVVRHIFVRDDDAYAALNAGYGRGLGALAVKWKRVRPGVGRPLTRTILVRAIRGVVRHRGDARRRAGSRALLSGIRSGMREAAHWRIEGRRFIDDHPPQATTTAHPAGDPPTPEGEAL